MRELTTLVRALDAANNATGRALEGMERASVLFHALERLASAGGDSLLAGLAHEGFTLLDEYIETAAEDVGTFDGAWKRALGGAAERAKT
ncbi:hypothetical protein PWP93_02165 [Paraburkholderia sp. A1RI-2L]|uniref:hypothetical protein n=1 Tax=Paraburkholderia sp. A1RI-2L TaxID=3028367 RepID=UPI003B78BD7A